MEHERKGGDIIALHRKFAQLEQLQANIASCRDCTQRFGYEPHPVIFGNCEAKIMQISQAPSLSVHQTGKPFYDVSGRTLRTEWYQISDEEFYNPDYFYITSIAHCYPGRSPKGGDQQPPKYCAQKWLQQEMDAVDNQMYLLIGRYAANFFFPKERLTALIFQDLQLNQKPAYVLPHPSPLNKKWLMDHPSFLTERLPMIRMAIHQLLK